jgi:hypothetical protein
VHLHVDLVHASNDVPGRHDVAAVIPDPTTARALAGGVRAAMGGVPAREVNDGRLDEGRDITLGSAELRKNGRVAVWIGQTCGGFLHLDAGTLKLQLSVAPEDDQDEDDRADQEKQRWKKRANRVPVGRHGFACDSSII